MALTGDAWNTDNPEKPWALFDRSESTEIVLPFYILDWLEELSATYGAHEIIAASPLNAIASAYSAGVISVRMGIVPGATIKSGVKYPFTIRLTTADAPPQRDDRTLWLKLKDR